MEIKIKKRATVTLAEGGISFCEIAVFLPVAEGEDTATMRLNRFYHALADGVLLLAREVILPHAKAAYEASADPRRRFTHRPYRIELTAHLWEGGERTEVRRTLTVSHRTRCLVSEEVHECILPTGGVLGRRYKQKRLV